MSSRAGGSDLTLLLATTNAGKLREVRAALAGLEVDIRSLTDLPPEPEPHETGLTFAENALLKARYYAALAPAGWFTVAEDSGLVIDALAGAPGVLSARYPGETYPDKFQSLYRALKRHAVPWTAHFVGALVLVDQTGAVRFTCDAQVDGEISAEPRGHQGFGYDPIFRYPDFDRTFGEVSDARKLAVSHRGKAIHALQQWLTLSFRLHRFEEAKG